MKPIVNPESVCNRLQTIVKNEELRVQTSIKVPDKRIALIELARAIDNRFLIEIFNVRDDHYEISALYSFGANKALVLFLEDWSSQHGVPLHKSEQSIQIWADSVVQHCGRLRSVEILIGLFRSQLVDCIDNSERLIQIRYRNIPIGIESLERFDHDWVQKSTLNFQKILWESLDQIKTNILEMMYHLVSPWKESFISYQTHPKIDEYFHKAGLLKASLMPGYDAFPLHTKFGGIEFGKYVVAMATLIGLSMKHITFVMQLLRKCPDLIPRNLSTIFRDIDSLVFDLAHYIGVDEISVRQIVDIFSLNSKIHGLYEGCPPPPFIVMSDNQLLHLLSGCLVNPFAYMLEFLKNRFRHDWDCAVGTREVIFRDDLYKMFPDENIIKVKKSIKLRSEGKLLTDIDAVLINCRSGNIGMFQLKWQDFFGNSMRRRESQQRNLLFTCNKWIKTVYAWMEWKTTDEIRQTLGIDAKNVKSIQKIRLFIIGRNSTHFSGVGEPDPRAAWGLWPQLQKLAAEKYDGSDPIEWLYQEIKKDSPLRRSPPKIEREKFTFGDIEIILEPPIPSL